MIPFANADLGKLKRFPILTVGIILLNTFVYILQVRVGPDMNDKLEDLLGLVPARLMSGEGGISPLLPLLTSCFLHDGLLHILSNMVYFAAFSPTLETRLKSPLTFLLVYFGSGLVGSLASARFNTEGGLLSHVPCVGASGCIAGVMGFFLACWGKDRLYTLHSSFHYGFTSSAWMVVGGWFLTQAFAVLAEMGTLGPALFSGGGGIAYTAHLGGILFGFSLGLYLKLCRPASFETCEKSKEVKR